MISVQLGADLGESGTDHDTVAVHLDPLSGAEGASPPCHEEPEDLGGLRERAPPRCARPALGVLLVQEDAVGGDSHAGEQVALAGVEVGPAGELVRERMTLFTEGPHGQEPLWLWLNEQGMPFRPRSWDGVFRTANQRCTKVLTPPRYLGMDPYQVFAPYATPHSARHSFALYMLVVLNYLMDRRFGLSPAERRDFCLLYGDPWFMVQNLLGHASRQTTVDIYLAPVAGLQLRAMLATADDDPQQAPMPELDEVFARIAQESEGTQDHLPSA